MGLKHFILFYHLAALVYGDVLVDYAEKRLEGLPNWIQENVDDLYTFQYPYYTQISAAFLRFELKPSNVTAYYMKSIRLLENPSISGSLFAGRLSINLTVIADLELTGNYEATGNLFPYVDDIPFTSSGLWSANTTLMMTQPYHISLNVSIDGSMKLASEYQTTNRPQTLFTNFNFNNFLEDRLDQWYYPIVKEGFGKELQAHMDLALSYDHIELFGKFFEETFENIDYSDMVGSQ